MLKITVDKVIREKRYSTTEIKLDVYHYWAQSIQGYTDNIINTM